MKIAIISVINEPWGGSEELWAAMAEAALANGHEVIYCTLDFETPAPKVQQLMQLGLRLVPRRAYVPKTESKHARQLSKAIHFIGDVFRNPFQKLFAIKPDLIIYNGTTFSIVEHASLVEKWRGFLSRKIILAHFLPEHNAVLGAQARTLVRSFFQSANTTLFVSERSLKNTERALAQVMPSPVIVRNPVNMPDTSIVPFPTQKDVYQLAMVGNLLCMHKGQDTMFQVLAQEQWINKPWHLNIYGQGMDRQYLEDLAQMYGIASKITFHGRVEDIRQLWAHNHLLLMPSVMEGMPLAVVEAMLCGRPVLATDVGGHAEWIDDNTNGFIAAASTFGSLQHALLSAWERKEDWEEMGKLAHAKVTKLYDPYAGKTFLNLIEKIVANGQ